GGHFMSVNSINYTNQINSYDATKNQNVTDTTKEKEVSKNYDTYEKGKETAFNRTEAQKAIEAAEAAKAESMQTLLSSMLQTQYAKYVQAMPDSNLGAYFSNLEVDDATRIQAQKDVAEDGYWGVEQTANRILDFAKALAGNDSSKFEEMKAAVEKGFEIAEELWGGELPEISDRTYERVMQGFDEWEKTITSEKAEVAGVTQTVTDEQV
ncbi:MAG: hypothetical protein J6B63_00770, partial [Treponema sp.]|nr:hypothetical protein [Treponema sp.]